MDQRQHNYRKDIAAFRSGAFRLSMLSRQASLQYAIKQQAVIAETARDSQRCIQFFKGLRVLTVLGAVCIVGVAISLAIIAVSSIVNGTTNNGAYAFVIIAPFMLAFAALTLAAEGLQARCVARFFGFMSLNVCKGLYSVFCGLALSWVGNVYKVLDNYSPGSITFDAATFVIGMINVVAGLTWMLCGSCNFVAIGTTPLKEEFANYRAALRMFHEIDRKERQTGTEQVTITIQRPAEPEPPTSQVAAAVSAADDQVIIALDDDPPTPASSAEQPMQAGGAAANPFAKKPPPHDAGSANPFKVQPPKPPPQPPPPSEPDAGSTAPLNPFASQPRVDPSPNPFSDQPTAAATENPFDGPPMAGMPVVEVEVVGDNPFDAPQASAGADLQADVHGGADDDFQKGDAVYYSHRTLGPVPVTIVNIDLRGAFDGGVTYLVEGPLLDGAVETMRGRLTRTKPD
jgi:hypothetical protein